MLTLSNCKYNLRKSEFLLPKMFTVKQNEHLDQLPGSLGSLIQILAMSFKCKEAGETKIERGLVDRARTTSIPILPFFSFHSPTSSFLNRLPVSMVHLRAAQPIV